MYHLLLLFFPAVWLWLFLFLTLSLFRHPSRNFRLQQKCKLSSLTRKILEEKIVIVSFLLLKHFSAEKPRLFSMGYREEIGIVPLFFEIFSSAFW